MYYMIRGVRINIIHIFASIHLVYATKFLRYGFKYEYYIHGADLSDGTILKA
jgi:hypothetical protein